MLISLLIFLLTLAIDLITDLKAWGHVNHTRGAIIRCLALAVAAVFDLKILLLLPGYACVFDMALNIGRKLPLFRIGETSWGDRLQRRYKWVSVVKYVSGVAGVIIYVIIKTK